MKPETFLRRSARFYGTLLTVVVVVCALWLVDSVTAARVESRLAKSVVEDSQLVATPKVYVGGHPFAQVLLTNKIPNISVDALDVDIKDLGIVNASTSIYNVDIPASKAYAGDIVGRQAELIKRTISLDGVAMGQFLGMTDLDISNPYDISPGGGVASEAQLAGTLPGTNTKSTVIVTLRLDGSKFRMEPVEIVESEEPASLVQKGYTLEFDTRELPLATKASLVELSGGSIKFEAERRNVTLQSSDLTPVETGHSEFTDYASEHE
ncbi:DUF2993 domain-containing protein [Corynebacterium breve]|uniref:DUF2993 domain-containing protein n=1 Tax=Corynebacterium breve TaxID=3049799 RepID=A0ABY8VDX5_9CORY|nr:DUF2993 domain-containing protein [Corynebacterium breve]WIM67307.1 DUF2993 domain-containing protein [Corynebacterium breve]